MNLVNAITSSFLFLILFWLLYAGSTTFSGEWIPPPIIIKIIRLIIGCSKDKELNK